jgi:hypothetical protein
MRKISFLTWGLLFLVVASFARCSNGGGSSAGTGTGTGTGNGIGTGNPPGGGTTPPVVQKDIAAVDNAVTKFMSTWSSPGMSIAVIHNDKLIYVKSYGKMSVSDTTTIKNTSLFRLASVSKQITSVAIMRLLEDGKLTLDSKVFGTGGILGNDYTGAYLSQVSGKGHRAFRRQCQLCLRLGGEQRQQLVAQRQPARDAHRDHPGQQRLLLGDALQYAQLQAFVAQPHSFIAC